MLFVGFKHAVVQLKSGSLLNTETMQGMNGEEQQCEASERAQGYHPLSGFLIKEMMVGKQFMGRFKGGFRFIIAINEDGTLEGKNHCLHHDVGYWVIDTQKHCIRVNWSRGWENNASKVFWLGQEIRLYDSQTGAWVATLKPLEKHHRISDFVFSEY